ncbi:MAG: type I phosphomannose isomerase catalytic subunit [Pseudomonadota bacterium]
MKVWGSNSVGWATKRELENLPRIGELWETYDGDNGSVITNGDFKLWSLSEMVREFQEALLGDRLKDYVNRPFPLLIKYLFPSQALSVQVHPDDEYALEHENSNGKEEMWVVLEAKPESFIIVGWKEGLTKQSIIDSIGAHKFNDVMNLIHPEAGQVFYIPPGSIHALGPGLTILEIQQNSDLTYRIYDWDRPDESGKFRDLHIDKALEVLDFSHTPQYHISPLVVNHGDSRCSFLCACRHFASCKWDVRAPVEMESDRGAFWVFNVISGSGKILGVDSQDEQPIEQGDTIIIPAHMGPFKLEPSGDSLTIVKSWLPDLLSDVISPLRQAGFSDSNIIGLGGHKSKNDIKSVLGI